MSERRPDKKDIQGLTLEELTAELKDMGEPAYRARQVFAWLHARGRTDFHDFSDIPRSLQDKLEERFLLGRLELAQRLTSSDGTEKYLFRLVDGRFIETVSIPSARRGTVCVSTQVGCKFGCAFCASGFGGFSRNLTAAEICGQVLSVRHDLKRPVTHVVFMGMGEPLDNFDEVSRALHLLNARAGAAIAARRMTISTCGLVPGIERLKNLGIQVELSVSLHAADDDLRDRLIPLNRTYPLSRLLTSLQSFIRVTGRKVTLEYALIAGLNDSLPAADRLVRFARRIKAKVNLIPLSDVGLKAFWPSSPAAVEAFRQRLESQGVPATIRRSKGGDIRAACGQLAGGARS
jgi:23S rRNA (adenine2503-C2)-methyltransferase